MAIIYSCLVTKRRKCILREKRPCNKILDLANITWVTLNYAQNPPVLSTLIDIINIKIEVKKIHKKYTIHLVHTRPGLAVFDKNFLLAEAIDFLATLGDKTITEPKNFEEQACALLPPIFIWLSFMGTPKNNEIKNQRKCRLQF